MKSAQTIAFSPLPQEIFYGSPVVLSARVSSGLPVKFAVVSGPASIEAERLVPGGVGDVTVSASAESDPNFLAAEPVSQTAKIVKGRQTIRFPNWPRQLQVNDSFSPAAASSSGLPVGFRVGSGPGELAGNQLTATAPGIIEIEATQDGDDNWEPAIDFQSIRVLKRTQEISLGLLEARDVSEKSFDLDATASSGLEVTYASSDSAIASITRNRVTLNRRGRVQIAASQPGNLTFDPAEPVVQTLQINDRKFALRFGAGAIITAGLAGGITLAIYIVFFKPVAPLISVHQIPRLVETGDPQPVGLTVSIPQNRVPLDQVRLKVSSDDPSILTVASSSSTQLSLTPRKKGTVKVRVTAVADSGLATNFTSFSVTVIGQCEFRKEKASSAEADRAPWTNVLALWQAAGGSCPNDPDILNGVQFADAIQTSVSALDQAEARTTNAIRLQVEIATNLCSGILANLPAMRRWAGASDYRLKVVLNLERDTRACLETANKQLFGLQCAQLITEALGTEGTPNAPATNWSTVSDAWKRVGAACRTNEEVLRGIQFAAGMDEAKKLYKRSGQFINSTNEAVQAHAGNDCDNILRKLGSLDALATTPTRQAALQRWKNNIATVKDNLKNHGQHE